MLRRRDLFLALLPMTLSAKPRTLTFETWDVFTSVPLTGNQLAVFHDGRELSAEQMLAITREMNFSESTFILPQAADVEAKQGVRVRIFTRAGEVPFAGHPTLGTAAALWSKQPSPKITLDLAGGRIPVTFEKTTEGLYGEMLQPEPVFAETHAPEKIAPLIGIAPSDITGPIENISTGRPNLIVMLKSLATVRKLRMDWPAIEEYFAKGDRQRGFYFLTREVEVPGALVHARKLSAAGEDPATGSAAGCAAAYLVKHGHAESAARIRIEQGTEMHRPSVLIASATRSGDKLTNVLVGGYSVKSAEGRLNIP